MRPLRLGLLGTGIVAEKHYLPAFRKLGRRIELVACANRTRKKAERYARLAGVTRVVENAEALFALGEIDAVLISLPIDVQPSYVLAALRAGKAVLSEKPIGPSVAAARRLIASAKRCSAPWLVGENFAFMDHVARLETLVKNGVLGEVRVVQATQLSLMNAKNPYFHTGWRTAPKFVGGFVVDAGVHVAHVLRRCFGPARVGAPLTAQFEAALPPLDTAVATLSFESGAVGTWTSCFATPSTGPLLRVYGSRGSADLYWGELLVRSAAGRERRYASKKDSFYAEFAHFADVVQRGVTPAVLPESALLDLELMQALVGRGKSREHLTRRRERG
ncbi:MAG TPA: Gfo/Idh/MocA family oxidoreductase [Polyangiaceae bacterium]|nr:Gfo/Idh/MocA family oxidoreductase [Polyangiaceae bacterium]